MTRQVVRGLRFWLSLNDPMVDYVEHGAPAVRAAIPPMAEPPLMAQQPDADRVIGSCDEDLAGGTGADAGTGCAGDAGVAGFSGSGNRCGIAVPCETQSADRSRCGGDGRGARLSI